tara:strand:- start:7652 stop:8311 length:660 start_codon:yes stop_codon:yes gene_type:complete
MIWNVCGKIGHTLFRRSPPDKRHACGLRLLNLGCGSKLYDGWINADFYRLHQILTRHPLRPDWMLDLTRRFHCDNDVFDGVYLEHVNEHLLYTQNFDMLSEVFRTMKPGGTLRIAVPSLTRYLDWNELKDQHPKFARYESLPEALSNLAQNHLHMSIWDASLMFELLGTIGFTDLREAEFGESAIPTLAADGESHRWESLYIEATKPTRETGGGQALAA